MTLEEIARERIIADELARSASDTSPVGHWSAAAARGIQGLGGALRKGRAGRAEERVMAESLARRDALLNAAPHDPAADYAGAPGAPVPLPPIEVTPSQGAPVPAAPAPLPAPAPEASLPVPAETVPPAVPARRARSAMPPPQAMSPGFDPAAAALAQGAPVARETPSRGISQYDRLIMESLADPYAPPQERQLAAALFSERQAARDPLRRMELERGQLQLDQMRNPQFDPMQAIQLEKAQLELQQMRNPQFDPMQALDLQMKQAQLDQMVNPQAEPPKLETIYDPETGMEKKVQWNPETQSFEDLGGVKAPSGTMLQVDPETGAVTFQQGPGAGGGTKPLTEGQSKDTVFVTRAAGALPVVDELGDRLTDPFQQALEYDPTGFLRRGQTPEFQQAQGAALEFLQAILRKDTGAAITAEETAEYGRVYIPRPGDSPQRLEQKRAARHRAVAAIEAGMPPEAILQKEAALEKSGSDGVGAPAVGDGTLAAPAGPEVQQDSNLEAARDAITRGADPIAVRKRLEDAGIDPGMLSGSAAPTVAPTPPPLEPPAAPPAAPVPAPVPAPVLASAAPAAPLVAPQLQAPAPAAPEAPPAAIAPAPPPPAAQPPEIPDIAADPRAQLRDLMQQQSKTLQAARQAIERGADRAAVEQRLKDAGVDPRML